MSFTFLTPLFWLGALAVAAPVWLHLRRRQEQKLIRFSTLRFLDDQPTPRASPLRLRDIPLFLLRALAVLLVVGAFAWPYIRRASENVVRESRVYILDNTLSHQAGNGFEKSRARILSDLGKAGMETQIAVVELTGQPRVLIPFGQEAATARRVLAELEASYERGSYLAAFRQANALLANSLGESRQIVLLGDSQENQWTESSQSPPFLEKVQVELPAPSKEAPSNMALSEPRAQRVFLGNKSLINFTAQLRRQGSPTQAKVSLSANGQVIFQRTMEFADKEGSITLQAQWEANPELAIEGELVVQAEPDALAGDNTLYFSVAPVIEGKVALLAQSPYLQVALSSDVMRGRWSTRFLPAGEVGAEMAADQNQDADVLVVESNYLQSTGSRALVQRYLSNGRGVVLIVNRLTPLVNGFLRELGFEAGGTRRARQAGGDSFQYVYGQHPVFHPFLSPDFGNLIEVKVFSHQVLRSARATPLVFDESGDPLLLQGTGTPGKLFVSAFAWDREQTTWPLHLTFIPFLDLCLQNARVESAIPSSFEPGEVFPFVLPPGSQAKAVVVRRGEREVSRTAPAEGQARLKVPSKPGVYQLFLEGNAKPEAAFAVNPSPRESQLNYTAGPEIVQTWQVAAGPAAVRARRLDEAQVTQASILAQKVWWWVLAAGVAVLAAEGLWSNLRKRSA